MLASVLLLLAVVCFIVALNVRAKQKRMIKLRVYSPEKETLAGIVYSREYVLRRNLYNATRRRIKMNAKERRHAAKMRRELIKIEALRVRTENANNS